MKFSDCLNEIKSDLGVSSDIKSFISAFLFNPSFRVLLNHRLGKYFYYRNSVVLRKISYRYKYNLIKNRHCDISYHATLGKYLIFPHPIGIVIGEGVKIKNNVKIFQQVTIGSHGKDGEEKGYPLIMNDVTIYAGAKVIGSITVGENAVIGANALVNIDVPKNSIAIGIPCRIINK